MFVIGDLGDWDRRRARAVAMDLFVALYLWAVIAAWRQARAEERFSGYEFSEGR